MLEGLGPNSFNEMLRLVIDSPSSVYCGHWDDEYAFEKKAANHKNIIEKKNTVKRFLIQLV